MKDRQAKILQSVIEDYVRYAEPVGSEMIARHLRFAYSPATIRTELAVLDEEGYVEQPYTSAGRIPADKGYRYFVDELLREEELSKEEKEHIRRAFGKGEQWMREVSRVLAEMTHHLAIVCSRTGEDASRYGLYELFLEPEFEDRTLARQMAQLYDEIENDPRHIFPQLSNERSVIFIGRENPVGGEALSLLVAQFGAGRRRGFAALIGPKRMRYGRNIAILEHIADSVEHG